MKVLNGILARSGCGEPEPRLIFQSGKNTIQAVYQVGVYADRNFMGSGESNCFNYNIVFEIISLGMHQIRYWHWILSWMLDIL